MNSGSPKCKLKQNIKSGSAPYTDIKRMLTIKDITKFEYVTVSIMDFY